ncbi:MAG: hypothetical protein WCO04_16150 [Pseudomonadota bacterium]
MLKGQGLFTDDADVQGVQHIWFVRSVYPHAVLKSVDVAAARAMPGVSLVVTGADLAQAGIKALPKPAGFKRADGSPAASPPRYLMAHERVRFVGEVVAVVVADSVENARNAAEAVMVDYDELPNATGVHAALAKDAPLLCDDVPDNIVAETRYGDAQAAQQAFAGAAHVVGVQSHGGVRQPRQPHAQAESDWCLPCSRPQIGRGLGSGARGRGQGRDRQVLEA